MTKVNETMINKTENAIKEIITNAIDMSITETNESYYITFTDKNHYSVKWYAFDETNYHCITLQYGFMTFECYYEIERMYDENDNDSIIDEYNFTIDTIE